jgi:hypothetical protein
MPRWLSFLLLVALILGWSPVAYAQPPKKELSASRTSSTIVVDGLLHEECWLQAQRATDFFQLSPSPGEPSSQQTAIMVTYDNDFVYIGAMMYDKHSDSILKQLTPRDVFDFSNTDAFTVTFDTYNDHQNAFSFSVTAAGVQADAKVRFDNFDYSWNAAWFSKHKITDSGWSVEMKIPYASLRFPATDTQIWGVNFRRTIRRIREKSSWNRIYPEVNNGLSQAGLLKGLKNIEAPIRLVFLPYVSGYAENYDGNSVNTVNGGMDIKYGLNESFTLDMTLIPDFGQTLYDNKVLNLSPIEVRYDERRYFFTEGVDLFNKNDLFYSRRVGGIPSKFQNFGIDSNEIVTKNPLTSKLYNATKISGRNKNNLGIGIFNAIAAPAQATIRDTMRQAERRLITNPLTNYNVVVLDQALANNSFITFVNTNVTRNGKYDANVSALLTRFATKKNTYAIDASCDVSQLYYPTSVSLGYRYFAQASKIRGNYLWSASANTISDAFNCNDLGYLALNNVSYYNLNNSYNIYKPFLWFNNASNNINISYRRVFNPNEFQNFAISGSNNFTLRNFTSAGIYWTWQPYVANDYFEPRTPGRYYRLPANYNGGAYISTDYRKKFAFDIEINRQNFINSDRYSHYLSLSPRYRFSDRLLVILSSDYNNSFNEVGFINRVGSDVYLGTRNLFTNENTISASYIFNSKMALVLNGRQYWSRAIYSCYSLLQANGELSKDINFNTFNIFLAYTWQFRPGSEMNIVYQNSVYSTGNVTYARYTDNVQHTFDSPQSNSISLKVIYYLDYLALRTGNF